MKYQLLFLGCLFCGLTGLGAASLRGFLLTKDDYQLTGYINGVTYTWAGNYVTFTNDFGDEYRIQPNLVKGFGFTTEGQAHRFVSINVEGRWIFIELLAGPNLRMNFFRTPTGEQEWVEDQLLADFEELLPGYWLQLGDEPIVGVQRVGFKRQLRALIQENAPALAEKMGTKGYRYRDLAEIVAEYNATAKRSRKKI